MEPGGIDVRVLEAGGRLLEHGDRRSSWPGRPRRSRAGAGSGCTAGASATRRRRDRAQAERGTPLRSAERPAAGSRSCRRAARAAPAAASYRALEARRHLTYVLPRARAAQSPYGLGSPTVSVSHAGPAGRRPERHYALATSSIRAADRSVPRQTCVGPGHYTDGSAPGEAVRCAAFIDHLGDSYAQPNRSVTLTHKSGQSAIGERLAAGLAGRAVLQARVGERDLTHGVAADRTGQPGAGVHPQSRIASRP